jgi:hypothetical protein|tara:strand:+ start:313 stop:546 length:234 start_codon:yes stop_codon:yes gene_type:complete
MKIMKVVELDLIAQRERLEYELENIINEKDDSSEKQVKKIKDLLVLQTQNLNSLQMWSNYMGNIDKAKKGIINEEQK